jgi:hypothetical protein
MGVILEILVVAGAAALIYFLYQNFFGKAKKSPYDQGFEDAVRYFGLKKLYEEDVELAARKREVFDHAGLEDKTKGPIHLSTRKKKMPH